ncbi:L,D-transpeptidase (plasmid) [Streptomyces sp. BI20]|uniref:L,D-transpeptidase n=1 Tax=Streptomyces sp. BI20 TaxID=3403460 RepID=UPI003C7585F8
MTAHPPHVRPATPRRRAVLAAGLAFVVGGALSACGGGGTTGDGAEAPGGSDAKAAAAPASPPPPAKITTGPVLDFDLTPGAGKTVGVGHPVSLLFDHPVKNKAAVEKALKVTTDNGTEGSWGWLTTVPGGADRLDWRPKEYWKPGTKVTVKGDLTIVDPGDGHFTRTVDRTFTIGRDQRLVADLDTHTLTVTRDGKQLKEFPMTGGEPVSGRASRPGVFALETREETVRMTSASVGGPKQYDKTVHWAMRFTDTGGYVHAAPWASADFGVRNGTAGCVGMADENAKWLFDNSLLGDLLTVKGAEATTPLGGPGNGLADWNLTWEQWQTKSALHT